MHSVALDTLASAGVPTGEGLTIAKAIEFHLLASTPQLYYKQNWGRDMVERIDYSPVSLCTV
jgi:hypothetical protein